MSEIKWEKWCPIEDSEIVCFIHSVEDTLSGLKIIILEEGGGGRRIVIEFKDSVWGYRSLEDGLWLKTPDDLCKEHGDNFIYKWPFFKVKNSAYVKSVSEESHNISDNLSLQHFVFIGQNSTFEVLNGNDPEVSVFNACEAKTGVLEDGKKVSVRPKSPDAKPILESLDGREKTKIRYGNE